MSADRAGPRQCARVLIVDDSPLVLHLLQSVFESQHYDIVTATNGNDGFEKARQCLPDLVVTDNVMPGIDGFALVRRLRENPETALIPVIMLTAADSQGGEHPDAGSQPDTFVTKSADMALLLTEVRNALERKQQGT